MSQDDTNLPQGLITDPLVGRGSLVPDSLNHTNDPADDNHNTWDKSGLATA